MAKPVEPPRFNSKLVKSDQFLSDPWAKWVRDLYEKIRELEARIKALEGGP
jgi:hypothetical protein